MMHVPATPLADSVNSAAMIGWILGQPQLTWKRIDAALAKMPIEKISEWDQPYPAAAIAYARAGRPDRARAMLAAFSHSNDTTLLRSRGLQIHQMKGEIALAERRPRVAIIEFRKGDMGPDGPYGDVLTLDVNLARAFDAAEMPDSAIAFLEQYVATPSLEHLTNDNGRPRGDVLYLAGIYKRLGELYEAKGDRAKAAANYAKFVSLWADADPELQPTVVEVRKRLARLRDSKAR